MNDMPSYNQALSVLVGLFLLAAGCSDAPVVPVQETSRNVLVEIVFTDST